MADSQVAVTAGTGTNIDTRTESTNGHHRQVVVLGDPATNAGVAPVDATAGLKVDLGADNDITGTVAVSSSALPTGASTAAKQPALGTAGTASADVITVQGIASMTALKVDGSAVTQPVSGTLAVSSVTTSVTPGTSTSNLGKAEDGQHTSGDTGVFTLGVRNDTPNTATTNTDGDYSQISTYKTGAVRTAVLEEDFAALGSNHVKKYYTNAGAVTDGIVWSPAAGKRWYVTDIFINTSAASTITLEDDLAAGDSPVWKAELAANSGWSHHFGTPLFSGEDAADLLVTTTAGNVYITVTGYEI